MVTFTVVLLLFSAADLVWCYPNGAPPKSCKPMLPGHFDPVRRVVVTDQKTTSPYIVNASWDNEHKYIRVSVTGDTIQGFIIQGKMPGNESAVGKFTKLSKNSKYQNCSAYNYELGASLTHTNAEDKRNLVFHWEPPFNVEGNVIFYVTLAKSKNIYWLKQQSNSVFFEMRIKNESSTLTPVTEDDRFNATSRPTPEVKSKTDPLNPGSNTVSLSVPQITLLVMALLTLVAQTK